MSRIVKLLLISASAPFLLGAKPFNPYPPTEEDRAELKRIQEVLAISQQLNRQPGLTDLRALRIQLDQYAACSRSPLCPRQYSKNLLAKFTFTKQPIILRKILL